MKNKTFYESFKENWYFIRQDIVSYLISTVLYIVLWLFTDCSIYRVMYSLFECLVFYIPFWFIRICFSKTYHSDSWKHCKLYTRLMLCAGVFLMWILPINYSLFNCLLVAFSCCLILYWIAIETDEKKRLMRENEKLFNQIEDYLNKEISPKDKLLQLCYERGISDRDTKIAIMYYIEHKKPKQILQWLCDNKENISYDSLYVLLNRLNKKLK